VTGQKFSGIAMPADFGPDRLAVKRGRV